MLTKRIIPCLDVRNKKVTKGVKFQGNVDLGDPIEMAVAYSDGGCDELVFYDITASAERRPIDIEMVREVGKVIHIPFSVGGGIESLDDMYRVLLAGAEKVSVNSLAVKNPAIIAEGSRQFGAQCIVLGMDPVRVGPSVSGFERSGNPETQTEHERSGNPETDPRFPSGYQVTTRGFREFTGLDALEWAKRAEDLGVGEIVVNSVDADGTRDGFELNLTRMISTSVRIPVVASGGAGTPQHLVDVFNEGAADAAIIASMIHTGEYTIAQIKADLVAAGVAIRRKW